MQDPYGYQPLSRMGHTVEIKFYFTKHVMFCYIITDFQTKVRDLTIANSSIWFFYSADRNRDRVV